VQGGVFGAVRILVALMWLANIHWKVPGDFGKTNGGGLYKYAAAGAENSTLGLYRWLSKEIILPNYTFFGWFTLISETLLAMMLLIGLKSRLVALSGAGLAVPIMLSVLYYPNADEWSWAYLLMIGAHLMLAVTPSGEHFGVDGVLKRGTAGMGLRLTGIAGVILGLGGLFVARSVDFAGSEMKLLGSDAGFFNGDRVVRRWELKFLWFNPLWALLTVVCALLLIVGSKKAVAALIGSAGFVVMAVIAFIQFTYDYSRDDGTIQRVGTGSNVAVWLGLAVAGAIMALRVQRGGSRSARL
jgi:uncharacterized membrane protein YphA (DoxX/SURF4 family)